MCSRSSDNRQNLLTYCIGLDRHFVQTNSELSQISRDGAMPKRLFRKKSRLQKLWNMSVLEVTEDNESYCMLNVTKSVDYKYQPASFALSTKL